MMFLHHLVHTSLAIFLLLDVAPPGEPLETTLNLLSLFFFLVGGMVTLLTTVFPLWMAIDCIRKDEERMMWVWIILFFPCFGAFIYFLMRFLPRTSWKMPLFITSMTRGREITKLEMAAKQIGNPYQFILLGDVLRETGKWERAGDAYESALSKESDNIQALWGAGLVAYHLDDFSMATEYFQKILDIDPQYKFGDVSLYMGKSLVELSMTEEASTHFAKHVQRWPQPEARYILAKLYVDEEKPDEARKQLDELMMGIASSPPAIAQKQKRWENKAKRLLNQL